MFLRFLDEENLEDFIEIIKAIKKIDDIDKKKRDKNLSIHKQAALIELEPEINRIREKIEEKIFNFDLKLNEIEDRKYFEKIEDSCKRISNREKDEREKKRCIFLEVCLFILVDDEFSKKEKDIIEKIKGGLGIEPGEEIKSLYLATSLSNLFKDSTRFLRCQDQYIGELLKNIDESLDYNVL